MNAESTDFCNMEIYFYIFVNPVWNPVRDPHNGCYFDCKTPHIITGYAVRGKYTWLLFQLGGNLFVARPTEHNIPGETFPAYITPN